ncbi:MAG: hypothetical protein ABFS41_18880 [Myxococcota bacterium]
MPEENLLIGIAEVAIALTGFAGVVVVLGRRASGPWPETDQFQLRSLIENGLIAVLAAFLPFAARQLSDRPEVIWGLSSAAFGTIGALHAFVVQGHRAARLRAALRAEWSGTFRHVWLWAVVPASILVHTALLLNAAGVLFPRTFGPYLVGLLWYLIVGSLFFVRSIRFG